MGVDSASLKLVTYPAPVLRQRASSVPSVDDHVRKVAARMIEIMRQQRGIGLAAPQVGLPWRLFVVDVPEDPEDGRLANPPDEPPSATDGPVVYINPRISDPAGGRTPFNEGCLSLPDVRGDVIRPSVVTIAALDLDAKPFTARASGLLARCWQHELDHLDGVLIIDRMTQMSRLKNRAAIKDLEDARA
jgi:peptide deformylase